MFGGRRPAWVLVVVKLRKVDSTMDYAKKLLDFPSITVVIAEEQSRGRGRWGRRWFSPKGGLWASIILECFDPLLLQYAAGISVVEALREMTFSDIRVRWPNDIILNGKKLGGILVEYFPEKKKCILGVGVNVYNDAPPGGISLKDLNTEVNPGNILAKIIEKIYTYLYKSENEIARMYENILYGADKYVTLLTIDGEYYIGRFAGVGDSLNFCLKFLDGEKRCFEEKNVYRIYWLNIS